jgi:hypothetical protein
MFLLLRIYKIGVFVKSAKNKKYIQKNAHPIQPAYARFQAIPASRLFVSAQSLHVLVARGFLQEWFDRI